MNYDIEIQKLWDVLNNLQAAFIQGQRNQVPVTGKVDESYNKCPQVDKNTNGVEENSDGLIDVADLADENSSCIEELADLIEDLEERVAALEEKEA